MGDYAASGDVRFIIADACLFMSSYVVSGDAQESFMLAAYYATDFS